MEGLECDPHVGGKVFGRLGSSVACVLVCKLNMRCLVLLYN
jgi:hypothetical protein